jgi:RsiW-degrading membrane proteinase PrsW (M82 family)
MIAWIWVDYFRMIDIFERESIIRISFIFLLGAASTMLVLIINWYWLDQFHIALNGNLLNDFFYSTFKVGLVEEFCKMIPCVITFLLFRKSFNEPLDYIIFISVSALGFSAAENVLYFRKYGADVIMSRSILSSVGHMFDTALIAYGVIRYQRNKTTLNLFAVGGFFLLSALSHGIYDFWLMQTVIPGGFIFTILFFLITISWFSTILNNAINNSPHFHYKHYIDSTKVSMRLLLYYLIVFLSAFILNSVEKNVEVALANLVGSFFIVGIIVAVSCIRLSRFTLLKNHWFKLKIEFPFSIYSTSMFGTVATRSKLNVKGENFNDALISRFHQDEFMLYPLNKRATYLGSARKSFMNDKSLGKQGEIFFPITVYSSSNSLVSETMVITSKRVGVSLYKEKHPIVGLYLVKELTAANGKKKFHSEFKEWCVVAPVNQSL